MTWSKKYLTKASAPASDFSRAAAGMSLDGVGDGLGDAELADGLGDDAVAVAEGVDTAESPDSQPDNTVAPTNAAAAADSDSARRGTPIVQNVIHSFPGLPPSAPRKP